MIVVEGGVDRDKFVQFGTPSFVALSLAQVRFRKSRILGSSSSAPRVKHGL
jgi:hypothetical protein